MDGQGKVWFVDGLSFTTVEGQTKTGFTVEDSEKLSVQDNQHVSYLLEQQRCQL